MRNGSHMTILCENDRGEAAQTVAERGLIARK
ncbi:UNVERIFIED_CONTAM: hypothetical protein NCL1_57986, partial [Trichonephila clavipes]